MNIKEYNKVKNMTYLEYCNYLQNKYGLCPGNYCNTNFVINRKIKRTNYGLFVHHICENHAILLSSHGWMEKNPYEYQLRENLVYCDYLEHLFLHILIKEYPEPDRPDEEHVGSGGIGAIAFDLFEFWSLIFIPKKAKRMGIENPLPYQQRCFDAVKGDVDVFLTLLKRSKHLIEIDFFSSKDFDKINSTLKSTYCDCDALKVENEKEFKKEK